jgi:hypothetical protein
VGARRGAEVMPDGYLRLGIFWDDPSLSDPACCIGNWPDMEPSHSGTTSGGVEVREDFVAIEKDKERNDLWFKDVTNNLAKYYPEYSGKLGYICEYDEVDTPAEVKNNVTFLYSLEGLSADDIVEECNIYLNNRLNSSQPDSDFEKTFRIRQMLTEEKDSTYHQVFYRFVPVQGTAFDCNPGLDIIKKINIYRGADEPQPGFEAYADWERMSVSIDLDIQDREKAIQVYEKFYEQLTPLYEDSFEIREDMHWTSAGVFWNEDHTLSSGVQLVYLTEHDDSYSIFVIKWHNVD